MSHLKTTCPWHSSADMSMREEAETAEAGAGGSCLPHPVKKPRLEMSIRNQLVIAEST